MKSHPRGNMEDMDLDIHTCPYCTQPMNLFSGTIDHIIPKSANGSNNKANKIYACGTCNHLHKNYKCFGRKRLPSKTVADPSGKLYIDDIKMRIAYVAGIRSEILKLSRSPLEVR